MDHSNVELRETLTPSVGVAPILKGKERPRPKYQLNKKEILGEADACKNRSGAVGALRALNTQKFSVCSFCVRFFQKIRA